MEHKDGRFDDWSVHTGCRVSIDLTRPLRGEDSHGIDVDWVMQCRRYRPTVSGRTNA